MKLLVVEDEALLRHHLQTRLTESGHVVEAVANAEEALYQTEQFNHDLAMIDLGLPGLGGLELIRQLEIRYPGKFQERFLKGKPVEGTTTEELLEQAAKTQGQLGKDGIVQTENMARMLLADFRQGRLGPISFEAPDEK